MYCHNSCGNMQTQRMSQHWFQWISPASSGWNPMKSPRWIGFHRGKSGSPSIFPFFIFSNEDHGAFRWKIFPWNQSIDFHGEWLHPDDSNSRPANRSRTWSNLWRRRRKESGRPGVRWYVSWGSPLSGLAIWEKHGKPMASWMMTWALSAIGWAIWAIWAIAGGKLLMLKGPNSCCGILSNRNLYAICLLNCVPICTKKPNLVGIIPATVNVTKSELWICCVQTENPGYEADDHGREVWRFPWWDSLVRSWTCAQYNYPLVMSK